jgi:hypothetical protein
MNHQKIYDAIIEKARNENRKKIRNKKKTEYVYYNNHHIFPKCMNGSDEQYNRQLLTDKEHYVCHKLLTYIYPRNRKIACAFCLMTFSKKNNRIIKSARDYAYARELLRITPVSEETREKIGKSKRGITLTEKHRNNIGKSLRKAYEEGNIIYPDRKGEKSCRFGKHHTPESNKKNSDKHKGKKLSEEHKNKLKGKTPWKGKHHSKESRAKMSKNRKGKPTWNKGKNSVYSQETLQKMRKPKSEEHRKNIKLSWMRRKNNNNNQIN